MSEPTSFDALAYELNLGARMRDLTRIFFRDGLEEGRGHEATSLEGRLAEFNLTEANRKVARAFRELGVRMGTKQAAAIRRF